MSKKKLSKVIILGDSAYSFPLIFLVSAKPPFSIRTYLSKRFSYVDQKFLQSYKATVGADFMEK
jgi:hypothetical protein